MSSKLQDAWLRCAAGLVALLLATPATASTVSIAGVTTLDGRRSGGYTVMMSIDRSGALGQVADTSVDPTGVYNLSAAGVQDNVSSVWVICSVGSCDATPLAVFLEPEQNGIRRARAADLKVLVPLASLSEEQAEVRVSAILSTEAVRVSGGLATEEEARRRGQAEVSKVLAALEEPERDAARVLEGSMARVPTRLRNDVPISREGLDGIRQHVLDQRIDRNVNVGVDTNSPGLNSLGPGQVDELLRLPGALIDPRWLTQETRTFGGPGNLVEQIVLPQIDGAPARSTAVFVDRGDAMHFRRSEAIRVDRDGVSDRQAIKWIERSPEARKVVLLEMLKQIESIDDAQRERIDNELMQLRSIAVENGRP